MTGRELDPKLVDWIEINLFTDSEMTAVIKILDFLWNRQASARKIKFSRHIAYGF